MVVMFDEISTHPAYSPVAAGARRRRERIQHRSLTAREGNIDDTVVASIEQESVIRKPKTLKTDEKDSGKRFRTVV